MADWISAGIGALSSLFGGRAKAPRNPYEGQIKKVIAEAFRVYDKTDLERQDARAIAAASEIGSRIAAEALRNEDARQFAAGRNPDMFDSEDAIARGTVAKGLGEASQRMSADLDTTRDARQMALLGPLMQFASGGYQMGQNRIAADAQAQRDYLNSIYAVVSAIPRPSGMSGASSAAPASYSSPSSYSPSVLGMDWTGNNFAAMAAMSALRGSGITDNSIRNY